MDKTPKLSWQPEKADNEIDCIKVWRPINEGLKIGQVLKAAHDEGSNHILLLAWHGRNQFCAASGEVKRACTVNKKHRSRLVTDDDRSKLNPFNPTPLPCLALNTLTGAPRSMWRCSKPPSCPVAFRRLPPSLDSATSGSRSPWVRSGALSRRARPRAPPVNTRVKTFTFESPFTNTISQVVVMVIFWNSFEVQTRINLEKTNFHVGCTCLSSHSARFTHEMYGRRGVALLILQKKTRRSWTTGM